MRSRESGRGDLTHCFYACALQKRLRERKATKFMSQYLGLAIFIVRSLARLPLLAASFGDFLAAQFQRRAEAERLEAYARGR